MAAADSTNELINAALEIAAQRSKLLGRIRELLERDQFTESIPLMKQYCGLGDEQKGNRIN